MPIFQDFTVQESDTLYITWKIGYPQKNYNQVQSGHHKSLKPVLLNTLNSLLGYIVLMRGWKEHHDNPGFGEGGSLCVGGWGVIKEESIILINCSQNWGSQPPSSFPSHTAHSQVLPAATAELGAPTPGILKAAL